MISAPRRIVRTLKNTAVQRAELGFFPVLSRDRATRIISREVAAERAETVATKLCEKLDGIKTIDGVRKFFSDLEGKVK